MAMRMRCCSVTRARIRQASALARDACHGTVNAGEGLVDVGRRHGRAKAVMAGCAAVIVKIDPFARWLPR